MSSRAAPGTSAAAAGAPKRQQGRQAAELPNHPHYPAVWQLNGQISPPIRQYRPVHCQSPENTLWFGS
jgi:hypothetical protein